MSSSWRRIIMPVLVALLIDVTRSATTDTTSTFDPNLICTLVVNGTMLNDPRTCNAWIECVDGEPVAGTCTGDLFYDRETEQCVPSTSIKCVSSNPCAATAGTDGFVADPYSCNGYYYCSSGTAAHGACSTGLNFNPGTQDCIRNFPCAAKMNPDSYCNIVPDGVFIKDVDNCNGWQMCWNGALVNGTCPGTFFFNAVSGICDYQQDVQCAEQTSNQPDISGAEVCEKAGDFVADNSTCNGYYYCRLVNGEMELQHAECPLGRFFDPSDGGACVDRTNIVCDYDRCAGMGISYIQLANESDDDCEGFALCQYGEKIGTGSCPNGEYFDEVTQLCTTQVISYAACVLSVASTTTLTEITTTTTTNV